MAQQTSCWQVSPRCSKVIQVFCQQGTLCMQHLPFLCALCMDAEAATHTLDMAVASVQCMEQRSLCTTASAQCKQVC